MATKHRPRLGFIGAGMMGQIAHLANYARLRDEGVCELVSVTDLKPRLAAAVAAKYGLARVDTSAATLLANPEIDAVVCIQQWPNNYALVKQILHAGKSAITEKPMVGRLDEALELTRLAEDRGLLYAVGFMKRFDPGVELAERLVAELRASGDLGPLLTVDALCNGGDWLHNVEAPIRSVDEQPAPSLAPSYPDGCRTPEQRAAYDYLLNIFSHNINLCHHLLHAELQPTAATFRGSVALTATLRAADTLVTLRGGVSAAHEWREMTTLTFARGEVVVKTPTPMNRQRSAEVTLLCEGKDGWTTTTYHPPVGWAFFRQAQGFVRALAGGDSPRAPAASCVADVRVMERLIEIAEIV